MATFETINKTIVAFDNHDVRDVNMSGGNYSATIYINTADGKTIELKFDNNNDLKDFVQTILTGALQMDWSLNYPSTYVRIQQPGTVELEQVVKWRDQYTEPLDGVQ